MVFSFGFRAIKTDSMDCVRANTASMYSSMVLSPIRVNCLGIDWPNLLPWPAAGIIT